MGRRATAALLVALLGGLLTGCDPIPASGWQVRLATANAAGTDGGNVATAAIPVVSGDGTKVAFATPASNLGPTDANSALDVYVLDLEADTTVLVSGNAAGTDAGTAGRRARRSARTARRSRSSARPPTWDRLTRTRSPTSTCATSALARSPG